MSCDEKGFIEPIKYDLNIEKSIKDTILPLSSILCDNFYFVPLNCKTIAEKIGQISKVKVSDNYIYTLSKTNNINRVLQFNGEGEYMREIGSSIIDELMDITDFSINKKENRIYIFDKSYGIYVFDENGKLENRIAVNTELLTSTIFFDQNKDYNFFVGYSKKANLFVTNKNSNIKKKYYPSNSYNLNKILINPLQKINDDYIIYRRFLNDTIFKVSDGKLNPYVHLNLGNEYPKELFEEYISKNNFVSILKNSNLYLLRIFLKIIRLCTLLLVKMVNSILVFLIRN